MLQSVFAPTPTSMTEVGGSAAVYVPIAGSVVLLNPSARAVWELIDGQRSVRDIVDAVARQHRVDAKDVVDDVIGLLHDMVATGALRGSGTLPEHAFVVEAMNSHFGVAVEDPDLRARLRTLVSDLLVREVSDVHRLIVVRGRGPWHITSLAHVHTALTQEGALTGTMAAINLSAVRTCPNLAVHAAVLTRGGRTVVLPGRSGLGKTTLTAALLRLGWYYVSDEALLLPWGSGTAPSTYPRPLALSEWSCDQLGVVGGLQAVGERWMRAADFGSAVCVSPPPVSDVILLERAPSERAALQDIDPSLAFTELFARGFTTVQQPARALARLAEVLRTARTRLLTLSGPTETAGLVDEACS